MSDLALARKCARIHARRAQYFRMKRMNTTDPVLWCDYHMDELEHRDAAIQMLRVMRLEIEADAQIYQKRTGS